MRILILSAGTRYKLLTYFKQKENGFEKVIATDCSKYAPALYIADSYYIVPRMKEPHYLQVLLDICRKENVGIVLPLQEDELELISENRMLFEERGILAAVSPIEALKLCRDKYALYKYFTNHGLNAIMTYGVETEKETLGDISFPIFLKPRYGCGSIGSMKADSKELLEEMINACAEEMVMQPFLEAEEYGVDVYIDFISHEIITVFAKRKIRMRAGETEKSVSVVDPKLFDFVKETLKDLPLLGPVDMDLFKYDGEYHVLEINPRFGGGYPHAYECGVNFPHMLFENAGGRTNAVKIGTYDNDVVSLKFSDVMIKSEDSMF